MSTEDKKPEKTTAAKAAPAIDVPRGVPVKTLRFARATQVPGHQVTEVVANTQNPNGSGWVIEYIAQMRHHRITYTSNTKEVRTVFVHEVHVQSWEPAAL